MLARVEQGMWHDRMGDLGAGSQTGNSGKEGRARHAAGGFYGATHSGPFWAAVVVSTAIPALYSITGGMRSSLLTDVYQVRAVTPGPRVIRE